MIEFVGGEMLVGSQKDLQNIAPRL